MKYQSRGFRSISAESIKDAARVFANRAARKHYGRKGYARTCNQNACSQNGKTVEYSAFIGYTTGMHETTGHNINFTVYAD